MEECVRDVIHRRIVAVQANPLVSRGAGPAPRTRQSFKFNVVITNRARPDPKANEFVSMSAIPQYGSGRVVVVQ
jgi:hypothetical protein